MSTVTRRLYVCVSACLLAFALVQVANAGVLSPFQAQYSVARGSLGLGNATMSLKPWGKHGCRVYHSDAKPRAFLRLFVGDIKDTSYFCPGEGATLVPYHFQHVQEGDADHSYSLDFDWQKGTALYDDKKTIAVPDKVVDPFLIQMAARSWLAHTSDPAHAGESTYAVANKDAIDHYVLKATPGGTIKTKVGSYDTIKVTRIDDPDKRLMIWVAPKLEYLPVRVERHKKGKPVISMVLTKLPQPPVASHKTG